MTKDKTLAANVQTELNKHRELLAKPRVDSSSEDESEDEGKDIDPASLHLNQEQTVMTISQKKGIKISST